MQSKRPYLQATPNGKQLIVDGKPFLVLGGELQNSNFSSATFMQSNWQTLADANINTVLGPVTWEQVESEEGKFNFENVDRIIQGAREHDIRLVLLWFGSFKNAMSIYAPGWVKKDQKRFPRARSRQPGQRLDIVDALSIFYPEIQQADAKAFTALMQHLKEVDEERATVIMVQVENEVGLRGDSRDCTKAATDAFNSPVPEDFIALLRDDWSNLHPSLQQNLQPFKNKINITNTSWSSVFGTGEQTDELFMTYHFSHYVNSIATAGRATYPIPLFTNVWQNYKGEDKDLNFTGVVVAGGGAPGQYPSGGGVANVLDVWQHYATSLDFIAPDVYLNDYTSSCAKYRHRNQPLFIPEQRRDEYGARRIWPAYGTYAALGTAPFGIDTLTLEENPFRKHYGLLKKMSAHVLAAQRQPDTSAGFFFDELKPDGTDTCPPLTKRFGDWNLSIERSFVFGRPGPGFGMVIYQGGDRFLLIGEGFQIIFTSTDAAKPFTGVLSFNEKEVVDEETGELETVRMLNGDETRNGRFLIMPGEKPDYGGYPISVTIPAKTRIAEVEVYALRDDGENE